MGELQRKDANWTIESNGSGPVWRVALWGLFAIGGVLMVAFGHYCLVHPENVAWMRSRRGTPIAPETNALTGYYGGAFCFVVAIIGYFFAEDVFTIVDHQNKQLVLRYKNKFSTRYAFVPFQNLDSVFVVRTDVNSSDSYRRLVHFYKVVARLKNGKRLEFGVSSISEDRMIELARRLTDSTGAQFGDPLAGQGMLGSIEGSLALQYGLSVVGAFGICFLYYKFHGGTLADMLHCSTTPLYVALLFLFLLQQLQWVFRNRF